MRKVAIAVMTTLSALGSHAEGSRDLFVGVYESESRENFGTDTPGEYRIEIVALTSDRYMAKLLRGNRTLFHQEVFACDQSSESYLGGRPPGRAEVLCSKPGYGFLSYSENGIVLMLPDVSATPVPKDPSGQRAMTPLRAKHHKTKYYARVDTAWAIYGFRKTR